MLDNTIKAQLAAYLEKLQQPIELVATLDDGEASRQMRGLLEDIAALSNKVSVRLDGSDARRPSFAVTRPGEAPRIVFSGLPMGHEFTSLVLALLQTGGHPAKIDAATIAQIRAIPGRFHFETFISLSCHNCPDVVQALNLMAVVNPGISHTMIDGALFQQEVDARQIMAVPTIYLNGEPFGQGRMSLEEIVAKIDSGAAAREAEKLAAKEVFDVLVVGGGPAGAAAAIYAARKGVRTGVVAERFGGQVLDTLAIENFVSVKETDGPRLAAGLEQHVRDYDVDIINLQRAQTAAAQRRRLDRDHAGERRDAQEPLGDRVDRRALARNERPRRTAIPRPRRRLLPALRRPAVQGQTRRGDRRRQFGHRSGDRPRRDRPRT